MIPFVWFDVFLSVASFPGKGGLRSIHMRSLVSCHGLLAVMFLAGTLQVADALLEPVRNKHNARTLL